MPPPPSPAPAVPFWREGNRVGLALILAVAAGVRLARLDLMEFKGDEAQACALAGQVVAVLAGRAPPGQHLPLVGLMASVGVPNPPLFVYLLALPWALWPNPLALAAVIALSNVAAVGLCHRIGRRYFSPFVGLAAAALYALAPWAVVFSRKIWAQDLLPVFVGGFLLAAHAFLVERRPRALAVLVILAAAAVQLHFSALILGGVLAGLLVAGRPLVRPRWLGLGLAVGAALYAPYLVHLAHTGGAEFAHLDSRRARWDQLVPAGQRLLLACRYPFSISGADGMGELIGAQAAWVWPFALVTGLGGAAGLLWLCWRDRGTPAWAARVTLAAWWILPTAALAATGVVPFLHYFIILFPVVFLGLAAAIEALWVRGRMLPVVVLALVIGGYAGLDGSIFGVVAAQGGAPGDYGVAYAHKAAAMRFVAAENGAQPLVLVDGAHPRADVDPEYRWLVERARRERAGPPAAAPAPRGYVLLDLSRSALTPAGAAATRSLRRRQFGPLTVFELPPAPLSP
jgi:hypothetical protein